MLLRFSHRAQRNSKGSHRRGGATAQEGLGSIERQTMSTISGIEFSIGLRHVLEDSLDIIRGKKLDDQRRELVLRKVGEFMNKAKNGSEAIGAAVFVDAEGAPETVEAYALLFHHLKRIFPDLVGKIKTTADVLQRLDQNENVSQRGRQ